MSDDYTALDDEQRIGRIGAENEHTVLGPDVMYGVSSGSYSDYRVLFMCATKKLAEAAAQALCDERGGWNTDASVESFFVYDALPKRVKVYTMQALVRDGKVLGGYGRTPEPELYESIEWEWDTEATKRPHVRVYKAPSTGPSAQNITVKGTSRAAVLKAYSDRIVQMLAPFADGDSDD